MKIVKFHRIYVLLDVAGVVRYVGVTCQKERARLAAHISEAKNNNINNYCCNWLKSLDSAPRVEVIEWVRPEDRAEREQYWISLFRSYGHRLTNATDGGEGALGAFQSAQTRAAKGASRRGVTLSLETRQKISASLTGVPFTPERCAKISASRIRTPRPPEECAAISLGQTGLKHKRASSRYHNVMWIASRKRWLAKCANVHIGYFINEIDAANAADLHVVALNLSSKLLNFP